MGRNKDKTKATFPPPSLLSRLIFTPLFPTLLPPPCPARAGGGCGQFITNSSSLLLLPLQWNNLLHHDLLQGLLECPKPLPPSSLTLAAGFSLTFFLIPSHNSCTVFSPFFHISYHIGTTSVAAGLNRVWWWVCFGADWGW